MQWLMKVAAASAAFFKKNWKLLSGAGIYTVLNWIYDNPLWMIAELKWGQDGVVAMVIGAILINTALLIFFRNRNTDFILWSLLDDFAEKEEDFHGAYNEWLGKKTPWKLYLVVVTYIPVKLSVFILWCLKKSPRLGDLAALLILPIVEDAFVTTMYLRHGYRNGLRFRDIAVYMIATVIGTSYWVIRNAAVVELVFRPTLGLF